MATATVLGGFFAQYGATLSQQSGRSPLRKMAQRALAARGNMKLREIMETLNGAAAGSTAEKTLARVEANSELGGRRVIETETIVNRATTAADVTEINETVLALSSRSYDPTPVANGDGNPLGTR